MDNARKFVLIACSAALLFTTGCDSLTSLFGKGGYGKLTKAEMRRIIEKEQDLLPIEIDEHSTLNKVSVDFSGNVNAWVTVSDEAAAIFRQVGTVKVKEACKEAVAELDLENTELPGGLKHLMMQEGVALQYILEDRYGTVIASIMVSEEALEGKETVGEEQKNPFAVRNVSKKGNK